jgi:hypothetical protein
MANKKLTSLAPIIATVLIGFSLSSPASAGGWRYDGYHGGWAAGHRSYDSTTASRSYQAQGAYGGAASLNTSCTRGEGCTRSWSRTLRNGQTASGTVHAQRGQGVTRSGTGFRGRNW